jgi:hypothetical protein
MSVDSIGQRPPVYHVSERIVETVAEKEDTKPTDLEPLFHAIDPDSLESLFRDSKPTNDDIHSVTFDYAGYQVTVCADGEIDLSQS